MHSRFFTMKVPHHDRAEVVSLVPEPSGPAGQGQVCCGWMRNLLGGYEVCPFCAHDDTEIHHDSSCYLDHIKERRNL